MSYKVVGKNTEILYEDKSGWNILRNKFGYTLWKGKGHSLNPNLVGSCLSLFLRNVDRNCNEEGIKSCLKYAFDHYNEWIFDEISTGEEFPFFERFDVLFVVHANLFGGTCDTYFFYDRVNKCYGFSSKQELESCFYSKEKVNIKRPLLNNLKTVNSNNELTTMKDFIKEIYTCKKIMDLHYDTHMYHLQYDIALEYLLAINNNVAINATQFL